MLLLPSLLIFYLCNLRIVVCLKNKTASSGLSTRTGGFMLCCPLSTAH